MKTVNLLKTTGLNNFKPIVIATLLFVSIFILAFIIS